MQRDRVDPHGGPERRHAAGERLDHREPEALLGRRDEHGVGGVDPVRDLVGRHVPHGQQPHVAGRLDRTVEPLQRPHRIVREQQIRPVGVEPEPRTRLGSRDRAKPLQIDPDREHRDPPRDARPGQIRAELPRDRRRERREGQRRAGGEVGAPDQQIVAVQRHDDRPEPGEQRRPGGQTEVRVDDVELLAAVAPAQRDRRAGQRPRPWTEREQLDLQVVAPPQRLDLVANERTEPRPLARRVHVRHDEDPHRAGA